MHEELELKLAVSPDELKRLRRDPLVRSLAYKRARTKRLHSTYFDTASHALRRRGMALRVRRIGKRLVQTLKVPGHGDSGLQHYQEYEAELDAEQPDLARVEDKELQRLFADENLAAGLKPVFTTEFDRSSVPLKLGDSELELALDQGEIVSDRERLPICEAELELVSGPSGRIFELALALHRRIGFRVETRTKAARGYQLTAKEQLGPLKASVVKLRRDMTAGEAFVTAARNCIEQIRANEPIVLTAGDPEGLHQLRVGVRRLRALVTLFGKVLSKDAKALLRAELGWLQAALGPARDWDVFRLETLAPLRSRMPDDSGLDAVTAAVEEQRRRAYACAQAALLEPRYTELLLRLELWLDNAGWAAQAQVQDSLQQPVTKLASASLEKRARKLRKVAGKHHELHEAEYHEIRILAKKLRYGAEFFQRLYSKKTVKPHLKALAEIQDALGSLNDAVVTDALLEKLDGAVEKRVHGIVKGWQAACIERDLGQFGAAWKNLPVVPQTVGLKLKFPGHDESNQPASSRLQVAPTGYIETQFCQGAGRVLLLQARQGLGVGSGAGEPFSQVLRARIVPDQEHPLRGFGQPLHRRQQAARRCEIEAAQDLDLNLLSQFFGQQLPSFLGPPRRRTEHKFGQ